MLQRALWLLGSILALVLLLRLGPSLLAQTGSPKKTVSLTLKPEEGTEEYENARREWLWSRTRTPGANAFRLHLDAYRLIAEMRKNLRADSASGFTQVWQPIASATTNWFGVRSAGAVWGVGLDPTKPGTVYTASAGGGVWKTTDSGNSWTPLTDQEAFLANRSFLVDPNSPETLYSGAAGLDLGGGGGILKSTDGGSSWSLITGPFVGPFSANNLFGGSAAILAIAVQPGNSQLLLVGTDLPTFALYRS